MVYQYIFHLNQGSTVDQALLEVSLWLTDIYEIDDPETGKTQIGGYSENEIPIQDFKHVVLEKSTEIEEIDWQEQWANFSPGFYEGVTHIDLNNAESSVLLLKPGAGFGDLSHPTTRLVLAALTSLVKGKVVFDIGCGSGILSIAAVLFGAKKVYGVDIDNSALEHSRENAILNQIEEKATFAKELDRSWIPAEPCVILMNMIESEQKAAWEALPLLHSRKALIVTSGILALQKDHYFKRIKSWGWVLKQETEKEGWSAFVFEQTPSQES